MSAFRLGGLLRLRRLEEEQAAAELARATAERRAAALRRSSAAEELGAASFPDSTDDLSFQAAVAGRASLMGMVGESTLWLAAAGAQAVWTTRRTAVRTLDKLEARHDAAVGAEEARLEQLLLDETALRRPREEER
jgi:flagellar FliJ protein